MLEINFFVGQDINDTELPGPCLTPDQARARPWLDYYQAIREAVSLQEEFQWNPSRPSTKLAGRLFHTICRTLDSKLTAHPSLRKSKLLPGISLSSRHLKLYRGVGTMFDIYHDGDLFITLSGAFIVGDLTLIAQPVGVMAKEQGREHHFVITDRILDDDELLEGLAVEIADSLIATHQITTTGNDMPTTFIDLRAA